MPFEKISTLIIDRAVMASCLTIQRFSDILITDVYFNHYYRCPAQG